MGNEDTDFNTLTPRLVAGSSAVAVVLVLGVVWVLCSALADVHTGAKRHRRVQESCGTVLRRDEVLTISAKMCAATGNMEWKDRYDENVAELELAIREVDALGPPGGTDSAADTATVNARLVNTEQEAFRLAAAGSLREAMSILESEPYELNKQRYSRLTQARVDLLLDDVHESLLRGQRSARATMVGGAVVMGLILIIYFRSLTAMRRYLSQLRRKQDALRQTQGGLERRVEDRTAELESANEKLQLSYQELQVIYDGTPDGVGIVDLETKRLVRVNPFLCRMLGYSESELLAMSAADIQPSGAALESPWDFELVAKQTVPVAENVAVLKKGGGVFYADIAASLLNYRRRRCVIGFFRDITERKRAHEAVERERQRLKQLLDSSDRERKLVSYEIHDGLAQQLTGALMQFQAVEQLRDQSDQDALQAFDEGLRMLRESISETRRLISGLRPPIIDEMGIVLAIEHLVNDYTTSGGPEIEFSHDLASGRLEPLLENALFRIAQESLANACRHSKSDRARIELAERDGLVRIATRDWGVGFEPQDVAEEGFGLDGIRERARLFGGHVLIDSLPGEGTSVVVELPIRLGDPDAPNGPT